MYYLVLSNRIITNYIRIQFDSIFCQWFLAHSVFNFVPVSLLQECLLTAALPLSAWLGLAKCRWFNWSARCSFFPCCMVMFYRMKQPDAALGSHVRSLLDFYLCWVVMFLIAFIACMCARMLAGMWAQMRVIIPSINKIDLSELWLNFLGVYSGVVLTIH